MNLRIIYQDADYVAVDKPSGLLVHKTDWDAHEKIHCMGLLRDQLGHWVYPVHRLDRGTSGVLLFALSAEAAEAMNLQFREKKVQKTYHAVVRGFAPEQGRVAKALPGADDDSKGQLKPAESEFWSEAQRELPIPVGKYSSVRFSLVRVETSTGRYHQVRRHLDSISHPLIGDTVYGDGKYNRFFREHFGIDRLMLHAKKIVVEHPLARAPLVLEAERSEEFSGVFI